MPHNTKSILLSLFTLFTAFNVLAQPVADFSVSLPSPACNPAVASFTNLSTGTPPLSYQWNFGVNAGVNSIFTNPSTTYLNCGTYVVTLTVTDGNGQTDIKTQSITIHCMPTASFITTGASGCAPLVSTLSSTSTAGSGVISSYQWDFGDGSPTGSGSSVTHTYTTQGCKTVTLIVTNSFGCSDDTTLAAAVCVTTKPNITYNATPLNACSAPLTTTYNSNVSGGTAPFSYQWSFPGGSPSSSTNTNPSVTYNSAGTYSSKCIVTDANGCSDTLIKNNYVTVGNLAAQFSITGTQGCIPYTVSVSGMNNVQSWNWTTTPAASPATASGQNASFTFNSPGSYQLCLSVVFNNGCIAQKCTTVVVANTPTANFSASGNVPTCNPPLNITYTNTSIGNNLTYSWSFPGGTPASSTAQNPPVIHYNSCGNYSVSLTVTNAAGCSNTKTISNFVNIDCPVAAFVATPTSGCAPLTVVFNSTASTGTPTQWKWNFGDTGNPNAVQSTQQNPTHVFNNQGCYDVRLIITNAQGCTDTVLITQAVCVGQVPVANFSVGTDTACAGMNVAFTNLSTGTNGGTSYQWDFQNLPFNTQSTQQNPNFNYSDTGWMNVTLIVCNFGCCDTLKIDSAVLIIPPIAKFTVEKNCSTPHTVILHGGSSIDADLYSWQVNGGSASSLTDSTITVTYPSSGSYTIKLTVTNLATGCTDLKTLTIQIRDVHANFSAPSGCHPLSFCFTNSSVDASSYQWKIFDSTGAVIFTSTAAAPCTTLSNMGKYSVQLIATDVNGCVDTMYKPDYIKVWGSIPDFIATPLSGCTPLNVAFTGTYIAPYSTSFNFKYVFGDPLSGNANTANTQNANHTYNQSGSYSVTFYVMDNHGCQDSITKLNYINAFSPAIDFGAIAPNVCLGSPACFFNNTTGNGNITYQWDFGDGNTSTAISPCHNYSANGVYPVTLTATDNGGCVSTMTDSSSISVSMPTANFIADTTNSTCPPLAVNFNNLSTDTDSLTTYLWDFGDGNTSSIQNPFHIYNVAGSYDVMLIATDANGCSDTIIFLNYIIIGGPSASTASIMGSGCIPLNACFSANANNAVTIDWNMGDGNVFSNNLDSICYTYNTPGIFYPQVILSDGNGCNVSIALDTVVVGTPAVNFGSTPNPLCDAGTVSFTDSTYATGPIASWSWNFGDPLSGAANISSIQNPTHFYSAPGLYPVSLSVITASGCSGILVDTIFIYSSSNASLGADDSVICPNQFVAFKDLSTPLGSIINWSWNFGDPLSGAGNNSSQQNPVHQFSIPGSYTVTLTITNSNGCVTSASMPVTVVGNPTAAAGPDASICLNTNTTLNATGGILFNWSPSLGLNDSTIASPIAAPLSTTTYDLVVTDLNGCTATDQVIVTVLPLPSVSAKQDTTICPGQNVQLQAAGATTYSWSPLTGLNNGGIANPTSSTNVSTTYTVTGTDGNGCTNSASVFVNLFPQPVADAGPDVAICYGSTTQLNGNGGINFSWSPAAIVDSANSSTTTTTPVITTTYTLTIVDVNGCSASDNVTVNVNALPVMNAGADVQICFQTSTQLNATGASSYLWSPDSLLSSSTGSLTNSFNDTTTTFYVVGTDVNGCSAMDSVTVFVIPQMIAAVGQGATICPGGVVQLFASGGTQYTWSPSESLDNAFLPNPTSAPLLSTTYTVIVSDGVCDSDTLNVTINVNQSPYCNAGQDYNVPVGTQVILNGQSTQGSTYSWSPSSGLSCTDCLNPEVTATENTTYTLTTTSSDGCKSEDEMVIIVSCEGDLVFVPDAFTPNGDNRNDKFRVRSLGIKELNFFRVYNRWGQIVWETTDFSSSWDGTFKGYKLPPGVYVYDLDAVCSGGENIHKTGNVTLIR